MSNRVNPDMVAELKEYGEVNLESCFNCGNCTAVCPLTSDGHPFPRNGIRLVQLGLRDQLLESVDPWLCYYCGECTATCPRGAEPAEAMMTLRRWLTAQYDGKDGHAAKFYTSEKAVILAIIRYALMPLVLLLLYHFFTDGENIITDHVAVNTFAPVKAVWFVVLVDFAFLGLRILTNGMRMFQYVMGAPLNKTGIPSSVYISELKSALILALTQNKWRDCGDEEGKRQWLNHVLLVSGYITMLVLIVGLLGWFQTDEIYPVYHPQRWLGYFATAMLIYGSGMALYGRYQKREQLHKFSQPTDWLFPAFLMIGAVTGIFVHVFRYADWPWPTYVMYTIHVMAMIAMLDTEVGVGKWAHMIYRPLAVYLVAVKEKARSLPVDEPAPTPNVM
jgi:ferredoxin